MKTRSLSSINDKIKALADYHLTMAGNFTKDNFNCRYHIYKRKQLLLAVHVLENAIVAMPSDFA